MYKFVMFVDKKKDVKMCQDRFCKVGVDKHYLFSSVLIFAQNLSGSVH